MSAFLLALTPHGAPDWFGRLREDLPSDWRRMQLGRGADLFFQVTPQPLSISSTAESLLFGEAYDRRTGRVLNAHDLRQVEHRREALSAHAWGRFVYASWDGSGRPRFTYRDPSGALEALVWRKDDVRFVASRLPDVFRLAWPADLGVDWSRLAAGARDPVDHLAGSPLIGVTALAPGQGLRGRELVQVWRPADWAKAETPQDPRRALAQAVESALAPLRDAPVLVELSGGLDSAIVAGGLRSARLSAINYYVAEPQGDERPYARAAAKHLGVELAETALDAVPIDLWGLRQGEPWPRPCPAAFDQAHAALRARQAQAQGAAYVLTGQGGDDLFFQTPTPLLAAEGVGRGMSLPDLLALARWCGLSIYGLGRRAVWPKPAPAATASLLSDEGRVLADGVARHPWLVDLKSLPRVKQLQIRSLAGALTVQALSAASPLSRLIHPLLSQPVMETCLSIACWRLTQGGQDRALARAAFSDRVAPRVLARRSKGRLSAHYGRRLSQSRQALLPLLLEGQMARRGLIRREAVESALEPQSLLWRGGYGTLLNLIMTELWAEAWVQRVGG